MSIAYVPPGDLRSAPYTRSFATITIANAIKTSIATAITPQSYTGAQLNGSIGQNAFTLPQLVSVTTAVHASSYNLVAITVTGKDEDGNTITDTMTLTLANGGETLKTTKAFAQVTQIDIPAMVDTLGSFTFGVDDIVLGKGLFRELRGGSAGNVVLKYQDGTSDTLPCLAGEHHKVFFNRITGSGTTALPLVLYP